MKMQRWTSWIFAGVTLGLALAACASKPSPEATMPPQGEVGQRVPVEGGGSYIDVLPAELREMLAAKDFFFVNVHVPNEGEIPGTDVHIPFDQINQRLHELPASTEAKIVLYCRSGSMSATAARELVDSGFSEVYNLDGGFRAWIAAGYPFDAP